VRENSEPSVALALSASAAKRWAMPVFSLVVPKVVNSLDSSSGCDSAIACDPRGPVYAIAPYERLSSALQSALMFREAPRIAADGCETGDWLHVDLYLTKFPPYRALLFTGSRYDGEVMTWARERASSIVAVGRTAEGAVLHVPVPDDPLVAVLVETMVAELAASELWRRRL